MTYDNTPSGQPTPQEPDSWPYVIPAAPPYLAPTGPRHSTLTLVLVAAVAGLSGLVLGAGAIGVVWALRVAGPGGTADFSPVADRLPDELPRLTEFVERQRGLSFLEDVDVEILEDDVFERELLSPALPAETATSDPGDYGATYAALGLTADAQSYYEAESSLFAASVDGFYDPYGDRMVVRGTEWTPYVEATVVHELTHALQDQHFDLAGLYDDVQSGDSAIAVQALVEGDAVRVENLYLGEQSPKWHEQYELSFPAGDFAGTYDPLADTLGWLPYSLGLGAVQEIVDAGGNEALNEAFRNPPSTSEQVGRVTAWLEGDPSATAAVELEAPGLPDGKIGADEGSIGAAMLSLLPLDLEEDYYEDEVLDGWRGDRYVTWHDAGESCVDLTVALDDAAAVESVQETLAGWTARTGGSVRPVEGAGITGVLLHSCSA
ncbi:MAG: hypothetical protein ACRD0W_00010 [Acidimicrobiales bacterium]